MFDKQPKQPTIVRVTTNNYYMANLTVSLTPELEQFIDEQMALGEFESKGQLVKKALKKFEEDLIIDELLRISAEIDDGAYLKGDLDELAQKIK